jgi:hypothetical protein
MRSRDKTWAAIYDWYSLLTERRPASLPPTDPHPHPHLPGPSQAAL